MLRTPAWNRPDRAGPRKRVGQLFESLDKRLFRATFVPLALLRVAQDRVEAQALLQTHKEDAEAMSLYAAATDRGVWTRALLLRQHTRDTVKGLVQVKKRGGALEGKWETRHLSNDPAARALACFQPPPCRWRVPQGEVACRRGGHHRCVGSRDANSCPCLRARALGTKGRCWRGELPRECGGL